LNMTEKDFEPIHSTSIAVAKWIGKTLGLPRKYIEEITRLAKVESKKKGEDVSSEEVKRLFDSATQIVNNVVNGKHDPEIVRNDEVYVNPISLAGENHEKITSFMDGLDTVFTESILTKGKTIQSSPLFDSATQIVNNVVNGKHDPEIVRNDEVYVNPISLAGENHEKLPALWMDWIQFSPKVFLLREKQFRVPRLPKKFQSWKQDLMSKQRQLR